MGMPPMAMEKPPGTSEGADPMPWSWAKTWVTSKWVKRCSLRRLGGGGYEDLEKNWENKEGWLGGLEDFCPFFFLEILWEFDPNWLIFLSEVLKPPTRRFGKRNIWTFALNSALVDFFLTVCYEGWGRLFTYLRAWIWRVEFQDEKSNIFKWCNDFDTRSLSTTFSTFSRRKFLRIKDELLKLPQICSYWTALKYVFGFRAKFQVTIFFHYIILDFFSVQS